jgi:hypothetical protein
MQFSKLNFGELKVRVCYRSWKDIRTSLAYQVFQGAIDATGIHIQVQCAKIYTCSIPSV